MLVGFFCAAVCHLPMGQLAVVDSQVVWNGESIGEYVDDMDPNQAQDVANGSGLVLAGIPPCCPRRHFTNAVNLYEYYPVGYPVRPRLPRAEGYILQGSFRWPHGPAATYGDRRRMWCQAKAEHPRVILWYRWGPHVGRQVQRIMRRPCPTR